MQCCGGMLFQLLSYLTRNLQHHRLLPRDGEVQFIHERPGELVGCDKGLV